MDQDHTNPPSVTVGPSSTNQVPSGSRLPFKKPKQRLVAIVVLVVLLGLAMAWGISQYKRSGDQPTAPLTEEIEQASFEIEITKVGFSPAKVRIKKGTTVVWTNQDTQPHHIASNPYPDHTELPELDSGDTPLGPGATYRFQFNETGTFGYHDHFNPTVNGVIEVVEE